MPGSGIGKEKTVQIARFFFGRFIVDAQLAGDL